MKQHIRKAIPLSQQWKNFRLAFRLVILSGKRQALFNVIVIILNGITPLALFYCLKLLLDVFANPAEIPDSVWDNTYLSSLIFLTGGIFFLHTIMGTLSGWTQTVHGQLLNDHVNELIHKKAAQLNIADFEQNYFYDKLYTARKEATYRPAEIVNGVAQMLKNMVFLAAITVLMTWYHWSIAFALFLAVIPGFWLRLRHARHMFDWQQENIPQERMSNYLSQIITSSRYLKELKIFDSTSFFRQKYKQIRKRLFGEKYHLQTNYTLWGLVVHLFMGAIITVSLLLVVEKTCNKTLSVGDLALFFVIFRRGISSLRQLFYGFGSVYENNLFLNHLNEFLFHENYYEDGTVQSIAIDEKPEIRFEDVSFRYPGSNNWVLQNVTMRFRTGKITAIAGDNGTGKSTIVKLLCRFYLPDKGRILINGTDIKDLSSKALSNVLSVMFQDFSMYNFTLKKTIHLGEINADFDKQQMQTAAQQADIEGLAKELPHGFDSILGNYVQAGSELSTGEWQKIAIARTLYKNAPVLMFDEPTSALSAKAENELMNHFNELIKSKLLIIVSHKINTLAYADTIYFLENGKIAEQGSFDELLGTDGKFARFFMKERQIN